ncbi:response regulator [Aquimarina sediminis]|uniref:response regulator n=1 Tax=Aquimarina sediminis TaxID=2070536 RepID=UPI000CA01BA8|nr:response regulator [Aquimarina sediminis]
MKTKIFIYILCLFIKPLAAQVANRVSLDSIRKIIKKSEELVIKPSEKERNKAVHLLELAESLAETIDNPVFKIEVNRKMMDYFHWNKDTIKAKEYLAKNLEIIKKTNNKRQLGFYYEDLGVYKNVQGNKEEAYRSYLVAEQLLRKYGETKDNIDINYNLSSQNVKRQQWDKSVKYALKSLAAIEEAKVNQNRKKYLYLFLAESYTNLGQYKEAKKCFQAIEKEKPSYASDLYFNSLMFSKKGLFFKKQGNNKEAVVYYGQAYENLIKSYSLKMQEVSTSLTLSNKLNLEQEENKRIRIENKLKTEEIKNDKYIMLFGTIIILALIIISVLLYKKSKFKTKVNRLLKENYKKLVEANRETDKALKVKSNFLDSVTHELLTPLNTIRGTNFLMQKEKLSNDQINRTKLIDLSADHLLNLINDVIHLNDLGKEKFDFKTENFDLKSLLNNLIDSSLELKNNNSEVYREIDTAIPDVLKGDVLRVSQIFTKIFDNALKFTKDGDVYVAAILISKTKNNAKIEFSIKDTGIGMTEEQVNRAFEAFNQGSVNINREYGGTGLGLSLVKKMLLTLGSDIVLKSKIGKGTLVSFVINFEIPKPQQIAQHVDSVNDSNPLKNEANVLLVEDNKVNQLITKKIISNYGFYCDSAYDGTEAVKMVRENKYSMVLMDIMMPKMDGFEATTIIREFNTMIPIVALTTLSEKLNKKRFNEVGIVKVLNKPVNPEQLHQTLVDYCLS